MVDAIVLRPPQSPTPSNNAYDNQLIYNAMGVGY